MRTDRISCNIDILRERIEKACKRCGRDPRDIRIVAVTKTVGADAILQALESGISDIGENRAQEMNDKHARIGKACRWHMIGHLQKNKVRSIIDKVDLIHSVDSISLAEEIDRRAASLGRVVDVLLQINVSGEDTKYGIKRERINEFTAELAEMGNIKVRGLMTIAPFTVDQTTVRLVFSELRKIAVDMKRQNTDNIDMDFLSMGMSNDFEIAIEEGANIIRIGTAIFGERD